VASRGPIIDHKLKEINAALAAVREACLIFHVTEKDTIPQVIGERYSLKLEDAKLWYSGVKITATRNLSEVALERTIALLAESSIIPSSDVPLKNFYDPRFVDLQIDIKAMKLCVIGGDRKPKLDLTNVWMLRYNKPELVVRTYNELRAAGLAKGKLSFKDLIPLDQVHHYHGTEAVDKFINECSLDAASNVISLGSGLGGPARYLSRNLVHQITRTNCVVKVYCGIGQLSSVGC